MATAAVTLLKDGVKCKVYSWNITSANPDGAPIVIAGHYPDKTIQIFGTPGSGCNVKAQGTNEASSPTNWCDMNDPQGTPIGLSAAGGEALLENYLQFRPYLSAGTGTDLTVLLCLKG